jgi:hypothetical protein
MYGTNIKSKDEKVKKNKNNCFEYSGFLQALDNFSLLTVFKQNPAPGTQLYKMKDINVAVL